MKRFIEGASRAQGTLFPECLEDWIGEDNPVRVIDVFVDELDLGGLGFARVEPKTTGRPGLSSPIQYREGKRWKNKAFCGTRDGLMDVALPHNKVAADGGVLAALCRLPEFYEPGALDALVMDKAA